MGKDILPFVTTWLQPEHSLLNKIGQAEKDRYCMVSLRCGI